VFEIEWLMVEPTGVTITAGAKFIYPGTLSNDDALRVFRNVGEYLPIKTAQTTGRLKSFASQSSEYEDSDRISQDREILLTNTVKCRN
jgi:hypothetical protein